MKWKSSLLQKLPSGDFEIRVPLTDPNAPMPLLWINRDFGDIVLAVVRHYPEVIGKTFDCATEVVNYTQFAEILSKGEVFDSILIPGKGGLIYILSATGEKITFKRIETFEMGPVASPVLNAMYVVEFSTLLVSHLPN